ncbi:UNVERIFIED_ORG: hypothetical protein ABIC62_001862 [Burkholderia sp. 1595]|uniref:Uncharacterized protein n=1 Tax=Paraburkholderia terricola TaxID=169427 RepID=A0ABU1LP02_9BURK|nr:hypothetical protein [Paraburkholderia terricola]MDR6408472.1 hypothetical protein [Paraburkholderia terricola]
MKSIVIDAPLRRRFLDLYIDWRRAAGDSIVTLPVEGPPQGDTVLFAQVPTEFLDILTINAMSFTLA